MLQLENTDPEETAEIRAAVLLLLRKASIVIEAAAEKMMLDFLTLCTSRSATDGQLKKTSVEWSELWTV